MNKILCFIALNPLKLLLSVLEAAILFPAFQPRYSREFWIGVCREGSRTLTLFKGCDGENWYPFQGPSPKNDTVFNEKKTKLIIAKKENFIFFL